jgi:anti-anti-sigma factor
MVIGELDLSGVETVERSVEALLTVRPRPDRLVVDLHELRFVDVVGLRALVNACWRLQRIGPMEVLGVQPAVRRVLDLANVSLRPVPDPRRTAPFVPL